MSVLKSLVAATFAIGLTAGAADAQQGGNLVAVNISNVANNIARDLSVGVDQIPVTVQVPIGVAANVCNVQANLLATDNDAEGAECDAETTSQALNQIVQRQMDSQ